MSQKLIFFYRKRFFYECRIRKGMMHPVSKHFPKIFFFEKSGIFQKNKAAVEF